jgi:hypothetical protein
MKIYISGKITGLEHEVAKMYFKVVEDKLRDAGHTPMNPMELVPYHAENKYEDYMAEDVRILLACEAILMLENWRDSKGARIEHFIAHEFGLPIYYMQNHNFF